MTDRANHRSWLIFAVCAVCAACALPASAQKSSSKPLEFKGLQIGKAISREQVKAATGVTCGDGYEGISVCNGRVSIATIEGTANIVLSRKMVLDRVAISISSDEFDGVLLALIEKFGAPQKLSEPVLQNGFGATFKDVRATWSGQHGAQLDARRYSGTTQSSLIIFTTAADRLPRPGQSHKDRVADL